MLNIVQDSALLEAIGCQMEMVRSIRHAICHRKSSFKSLSSGFKRQFVCKSTSLTEGSYLKILPFFFCCTGVLSSEPCACYAGALLLEPYSQTFFH
jgi:hypothetical protein